MKYRPNRPKIRRKFIFKRDRGKTRKFSTRRKPERRFKDTRKGRKYFFDPSDGTMKPEVGE